MSRSRTSRSANNSSVSTTDTSRGGVHPIQDVDDIGVREAADQMDESVDLPDVPEELVAEALAPAGSPDQTGNVDELNEAGRALAGCQQPLQFPEPRVRDRHLAHVLIDGGKRIIGYAGRSRGQRVEEGGLAHVGQADDPQ